MSATLLRHRRSRSRGLARLVPVVVALLVMFPGAVTAKSFGAWQLAVAEPGVNTAAAAQRLSIIRRNTGNSFIMADSLWGWQRQ